MKKDKEKQKYYLEATFPANLLYFLVFIKGIAKHRGVRAIFDYRNGILKVYYNKDDILRDSQKTTDQILKNKKYLNKFLNFCYNFADEILHKADTYKNIHPSIKSNKELWKMAKKVTDIIDLQGKTVIKARKRPSEILQEYLENQGVRSIKTSYILGQMIVFSEKNLGIIEEKEFLKKILKSPKRKHPDIFKKHLNKWKWLYTNILTSSSLTTNDLKKRCKNPKIRLQRINKKIRQDLNTKNRLIKKYIKNKKMLQLLKILELEGFYRLHRRYVLSKLSFYTKPVFNEIAKRIGTKNDLIYLLTPEEIKELLLKRKKVQQGLQKTILQRKKHCLIFIDNNIKFYYKNITQLLKKSVEIPNINSKINIIQGTIGNKGKVQGMSFIINSSKDFHKITQSDSILVAPETTPEFIPVLKKVIGVVTDRGGITCHAAITSRELGIPCIIGTKIATQVLKDGDMVEVDANNGIVRKLNKMFKRKIRRKKTINGVLYSVGAVIYNNKKQILMLKRKGKKWERGWEIVKGGIYFGETLKKATLREIAEETGVKVKIIKLIPKIFWAERPWRNGKIKIRARVFICEYLSGKIKLGEPEHIGYKWMTIEEAKKKIWLKGGDEIFDYFKNYVKQNKQNL